jgi:hypothetical protein
MQSKRNRYLGITGRVFFSIALLFLGYRVLRFELSLQSYEKTFLYMEHPANTTRLDSLQFELNDYPATYVDHSVQFQSTFLVGELRSYDGDWASLQTFHADQQLERNGSNVLPVRLWTMPLQIHNDSQRSWLEFPSDFSFDPFQADLLKELQESYDLKRIVQTSGGSENNLYLVYATVDP